MVDAPVTQTPNEKLARTIVDALLRNSILSETRKNDALKKIQSGRASEFDWLIWAEDIVISQEEVKDAIDKD